MGTARIEALGVRYCGALTDGRAVGVLAASAAAGVLRPILSSGVSMINARAAARERGIDIVESRSSRARDYATLLTITLKTDRGERWVEGTVFEPNSLRLVSVRDVKVEAPLGGTMLIIANDDQPGVIGEVGTILGRHKVNIANFALGRNDRGAVGVVNVDEEADSPLVLDDGARGIAKGPGHPRSVGRAIDLTRDMQLREHSKTSKTRRNSMSSCSRAFVAMPLTGVSIERRRAARPEGRAPAAACPLRPAPRPRETPSAGRIRWSPAGCGRSSSPGFFPRCR